MSPIKQIAVQDKIPLDFASGAIWLLGSVLGKTWRFTVNGTKTIDPFKDQDKGVIYCFWHSNILPLAYIFRNTGVTAVVSASRDGDRATAVAQRWNHDTIRGSSSRGQIGVIRQCMRVLANKRNIVIIPDGPHGPAMQIKQGPAMIAMMTNAAVYPVKAEPEAAWRLKSWDRFIIPKPFTTIRVTIGDPLFATDIPQGENRVAQFTNQLQKAMNL
jgi:lysophospholipid acyltransferase (LPLAT)-like uncharacterized protein